MTHNHDGTMAHLEPDILECEFKWPLGSVTKAKLLEVMEFKLSYLKSKKMMLLKCCTQYARKFGKPSSSHRIGKCQFFPIPKKGNAKECSNYCTITLISHVSKLVIKILQARLQQYIHQELAVVQAGFRKGRGTRHKIANKWWIIGKSRELKKKKSPYASLTLIVWITANCVENS